MAKVLLEMHATLLQRGKSAFWCLQDCCNGEKVVFGICKIVATRRKCFWGLARLLQRRKSAFEACKIVATGKKRFLALVTMLQAFPKELWPLQRSIKDILPG